MSDMTYLLCVYLNISAMLVDTQLTPRMEDHVYSGNSDVTLKQTNRQMLRFTCNGN